MNSGFSDASSGSRTVSASGTDCSAAGSAAFPATGSDGVVSSMENSDSGSEATGPDSVTGSAAEISGSEIGFVPPSESDCATNASAESATTSGSPAGSSAGSECRAKFTPGSTVCSDPNSGFDSGTVSGSGSETDSDSETAPASATDSDSKAVPTSAKDSDSKSAPASPTASRLAAASGSKAETGPACASTANGSSGSISPRSMLTGISVGAGSAAASSAASSRTAAKSASAPKRTASYNSRSFSSTRSRSRAAVSCRVFQLSMISESFCNSLRTYFKSMIRTLFALKDRKNLRTAQRNRPYNIAAPPHCRRETEKGTAYASSPLFRLRKTCHFPKICFA